MAALALSLLSGETLSSSLSPAALAWLMPSWSFAASIAFFAAVAALATASFAACFSVWDKSALSSISLSLTFFASSIISIELLTICVFSFKCSYFSISSVANCL